MKGRATHSMRFANVIARSKWVVVSPLLLLVVSASAQPKPRYDTPEATIRTYFDALRRGDQPAAAICFEPEVHDFYLPGPVTIDKFVIRKREVYGLSDEKKWQGVGYTNRILKGDVGLYVDQIMDGSKTFFYYRLRHVRSEWKIVEYASDTR